MTESPAPGTGMTDEEFYDLFAYSDVDAARVSALLDVQPGLIAAKSDRDATPLMLAAMNGRDDVVSLLLSRGADIDARDDEGGTALFWALSNKNPDTALLLLKCGADWTISDVHHDTPYDLARKRHQDSVARMIETCMEAESSSGRSLPPRTALDIYVAATQGHAGELRQIVADYPDASTWVEPVTGATALRGLVAYEKLGVEDAKFLIDHGADVNAKDNGGWTPLMFAVDSERPGQFTDMLLAAGADPLVKNSKGETAADIAFANKNPHLAKIKLAELEWSCRETRGPVTVRKPLALKRGPS